MLGPIINAAAIIICSLIGVLITRLIKGGIPEKYNDIIMKGLGLTVLLIGLQGALQVKHIVLMIFSIVIGSLIGEFIDIDANLNKFGKWAEVKIGFSEGTFAKGFVTASLIFCVGSMAIVGSLQSGLTGDHSVLDAKSVLDGFASIIFSSAMGIGVMFSSLPVLIYEGAIALGASFVKSLMTQEIITEMSAVGGLLIAALGFNFLEIKPIKVANMIPAIFIPWLFFAIKNLFV